MLSLREALTRATDQLAAHPALRPNALADAALLLTHCLDITRATLIAHPEQTIDRDQQAAYQRLIERRLRFEPIQYILGSQEFFGLSLRVTPAVLIPRPETEHLVEAVLARLPPDRALRILDVGTGSGAIAIALAHHLEHAAVTAVDLAPDALALARENAAANDLSRRIRFLVSDLLNALAFEPPFDAIVSNPPYVASGDKPALHPQVRDHEPEQALFSGPTGFEIYERLIPQAFSHLVPGGLLALELGQGQQPGIAALIAAEPQCTDVAFLPDLQSIPRVAIAYRRP